jgi:hypothetical protein
VSLCRPCSSRAQRPDIGPACQQRRLDDTPPFGMTRELRTVHDHLHLHGEKSHAGHEDRSVNPAPVLASDERAVDLTTERTARAADAGRRATSRSGPAAGTARETLRAASRQRAHERSDAEAAHRVRTACSSTFDERLGRVVLHLLLETLTLLMAVPGARTPVVEEDVVVRTSDAKGGRARLRVWVGTR